MDLADENKVLDDLFSFLKFSMILSWGNYK